MLDESSRTIVTFVPFLQVDLGPWSPYGRFRRRLVRIDRMLLEEIERRRRSADRSARSDVLSLLLDAVDEDGKPMTAEELRDELVTLLVAGHETSATSLAWTLYYVLRHPRVLAAVRAELREAFGDGPVTPGGIQGLRYLDAVVKEVARLRPILTFVARNLQSPVSLGEWRLPAGMTVAPCIYLVHRREDLYAAPEAFRPERFFDAKPSPYEYFPFGGGARRCLGMAFALYEMKVVLATVLSSVALELPEDSDVRAVRRAITIAPSDGVRVVARDLS
jgi:cytochrome P450